MNQHQSQYTKSAKSDKQYRKHLCMGQTPVTAKAVAQAQTMPVAPLPPKR